jgi:hypothetical protein
MVPKACNDKDEELQKLKLKLGKNEEVSLVSRDALFFCQSEQYT